MTSTTAPKRSYGLAFVFAVFAVPVSARAEEVSESDDAFEVPPPMFGDPKQWVVSGAFDVSAGSLFYSETDDSSRFVQITPSLDHFLVKGLSLGGSLVVAHRNVTTTALSFPIETTSTSFGAGVRVGYNFSFSRVVSLWPRLGVGVSRQHLEQEGSFAVENGFDYEIVGLSREYDVTTVWVDVYVPLLIHPTQHFFFGIGPEIFEDISNEIDAFENRRHFRGITSMVAGWF